mgnify:CR=1 FL=1
MKPSIKNLLVLSASLLFMSMSYSQEKAVDSIKVKQTYTKTEHITTIEGKKYPVYLRKNKINYFIKMIDKKTGREYWQLLERLEITNDERKENN